MYATRAQFETAFDRQELLELCPNGAGGVDDEKITAALTRASRLSDTYLSVRTSVPILSPSEELIGSVLDLARYFLYDNSATEEVVRRHDLAMRWFRDIAAGRAVLYSTAEDSESPANAVVVNSPSPIFTESLIDKMVHRD